MAELRELQRKLESIGSLREVVNAMRNLAAVYVRRAEGALDAMRPYSEVVETALHVALQKRTVARVEGEEARCLAVVFGSDQGLCGNYNERLVRAVLAFKQEARRPVDFAAVGRRASDMLRLREIEPVLSSPAPTSLEGIRAQVPELAAEIFETHSARNATEMAFIYNAYEGMGRSREEVRQVLPPVLDPAADARTRAFSYEPLVTTTSSVLLAALMEEYFFIELYRAMLESHSSENGARLLTMTSASSNIDERLGELTKEFQAVRQDTITAELLDVVGGAEALRTGGEGRGVGSGG
jgi:F-type H+-transporting ATPase subunit gamma